MRTARVKLHELVDVADLLLVVLPAPGLDMLGLQPFFLQKQKYISGRPPLTSYVHPPGCPPGAPPSPASARIPLVHEEPQIVVVHCLQGVGPVIKVVHVDVKPLHIVFQSRVLPAFLWYAVSF